MEMLTTVWGFFFKGRKEDIHSTSGLFLVLDNGIFFHFFLFLGLILIFGFCFLVICSVDLEVMKGLSLDEIVARLEPLFRAVVSS